MRLIIRDDAQHASSYIANYLIDRINAFHPTPSKPFVLGLPTGSSPVLIYKHLVQRFKAGDVSFRDVVTFNMDEYVSLPRDHPQSYHTFMYTHLFSHIDINPKNIHILDGNAPDLEAECQAYEDKIRAAGGIEVFLGGIGPDGHIAFNEPGSSFRSRTRVKTLAYDTILANSRFFGNHLDEVPRMALTVGVQTILDAREIIIIITGPHKAVALQKSIEGGLNHMWTLSSLQLHPRSMIVVDEDATAELQVKTVKYFKSIEQVTNSLGFDQSFPINTKKRDSVVSDDLDTPNSQPSSPPPLPQLAPIHPNAAHNPIVPQSNPIIPQPNNTSLQIPTLQLSASRSPSPNLEAMSLRIRQDGVGTGGYVEPVEELVVGCMSARVVV